MFCTFRSVIVRLLNSTSPSNCVSDHKHHHGSSEKSGTAASEAAGGHNVHCARLQGLPDGVRGQQCPDEAHNGGIQLLHGLSCTADC